MSVRVCENDHPNWEDVDLVHGFDLRASHVREARSRGLPVCLSPIYWSKAYRFESVRYHGLVPESLHRARMVTILALAALRGRHVAKAEALVSWTIETRALYESVDLLLPNSGLEAEELRRELGVTTPVRVIPNGVDPDRFRMPGDGLRREGILYVGRIEPHKNQLGLIEATRGLNSTLTLVGVDHPDHKDYALRVRRAGGRGVRILGYVPDARLPELYSRAQIHAIPSRFETTGLVSLEAALCGCNIVTTRAGYAREYFEDDAWYCDPYDPHSIREAVVAALSAPPPESLRKRILARYTWEQTALETADAYRELLERTPRRCLA